MSLLKKGVRLYVFASLLRPGVYASTTSEAEIFDGVALTHSKLSLTSSNPGVEKTSEEGQTDKRNTHNYNNN